MLLEDPEQTILNTNDTQWAGYVYKSLIVLQVTYTFDYPFCGSHINSHEFLTTILIFLRARVIWLPSLAEEEDDQQSPIENVLTDTPLR